MLGRQGGGGKATHGSLRGPWTAASCSHAGSPASSARRTWHGEPSRSCDRRAGSRELADVRLDRRQLGCPSCRGERHHRLRRLGGLHRSHRRCPLSRPGVGPPRDPAGHPGRRADLRQSRSSPTSVRSSPSPSSRWPGRPSGRSPSTSQPPGAQLTQPAATRGPGRERRGGGPGPGCGVSPRRGLGRPPSRVRVACPRPGPNPAGLSEAARWATGCWGSCARVGLIVVTVLPARWIHDGDADGVVTARLARRPAGAPERALVWPHGS